MSEPIESEPPLSARVPDKFGSPLTVIVQLNIKIVREPRGLIVASQSFANDVVVRAPLPEMDDFTKQDIDVMLQDLQEVLA